MIWLLFLFCAMQVAQQHTWPCTRADSVSNLAVKGSQTVMFHWRGNKQFISILPQCLRSAWYLFFTALSFWRIFAQENALCFGIARVWRQEGGRLCQGQPAPDLKGETHMQIASGRIADRKCQCEDAIRKFNGSVHHQLWFMLQGVVSMGGVPIKSPKKCNRNVLRPPRQQTLMLLFNTS